MFDPFSVNPMIREVNLVVKKKNPKNGVFWAFLQAGCGFEPINRGFGATGGGENAAGINCWA